MFNRVKSAFASAVGGFDVQSASNTSQILNNLSSKYPYSRPHFLNLNLQEEVPLSADHRVRPIIVPRERNALPWCTGYAECVNAGKSSKNEDQASVYEFSLPVNVQSLSNNLTISCTYFGVFDGHAGFGAAVCAASQLHFIIEEKLLDVVSLIWEGFTGVQKKIKDSINYDLLIIGALEKSFIHMDEIVAEDRDKYLAAGGCTAIVALFMLGKVYIANAGDSRVIHCYVDSEGISHGIPMSYDFTPESEKPRIRQLAEQKPELLCGEYTWREYQKQPSMYDLGKQIVYRDAFMVGWTTKTLTKEDMKLPIISGEGKRSRVMNTIGVTRGFGDHDLKAINSKIPIKPFLSCHPEVNVLNLVELELHDEQVIVMGTDGLWDVTSNEKAAEIVNKILSQFCTERHKYISAAQALVANARGKPFGESFWRTSEGRMATADDVSCFVIPLAPYWQKHQKMMEQINQLTEDNCL